MSNKDLILLVDGKILKQMIRIMQITCIRLPFIFLFKTVNTVKTVNFFFDNYEKMLVGFNLFLHAIFFMSFKNYLFNFFSFL